MSPLIQAQDRLVLLLTAPGKLRAGDVFAFLRTGRIVVHRLIMKRQAGAAWQYCEKGDGLFAWNWVEERAVIGRLEEIVSSGRRLDLQSRPWRLLNPACALAWSAWIFGYERLRALKLRRFGADPLPRLVALPVRGMIICVHWSYRLALRIIQRGASR